MEKKAYITYWLKSAEQDLTTIEYLLKGKRYVHGLFFCHPYLEKYCKALWIKTNKGNYPPKTHNLLTLLKETNVVIDDENKVFMLKLNQYHIDGRYPEDIDKLNKTTNQDLAKIYFDKTLSIATWIQSKLQ